MPKLRRNADPARITRNRRYFEKKYTLPDSLNATKDQLSWHEFLGIVANRKHSERNRLPVPVFQSHDYAPEEEEEDAISGLVEKNTGYKTFHNIVDPRGPATRGPEIRQVEVQDGEAGTGDPCHRKTRLKIEFSGHRMTISVAASRRGGDTDKPKVPGRVNGARKSPEKSERASARVATRGCEKKER